jgi:surface protein
MALTLGSVISRAEYNAIQSKIESVLGDNGVNDQFGYGRATESSQITTSKVIASEDMLALYNDLVKARTHQKGSSNLAWTGDGLNAPSDAETIGVYAADVGVNPLDPNDISSAFSANDTDEGFLDFDNAANDIVNGHDLIGAAQVSVSSGSNSLRDTDWGGNDASLPGSSINHTITVTWQNADERRYFFNTGGEIQFSALNEQGLTFGGSEGAKTLNWRSMMSTQGTIVFGKSATAANGSNPGSGSSIGNYYSQWANTSSSNPVTLYTKTGSGVYADNYYTIKAWQTAANSLRFDIIFQDADLGEGGPLPDTPVDEFVTGEMSSYVNIKTATSVGISVPTVTTNSNLSGTASNQASITVTGPTSAVGEGSTVTFNIATSNVATGTVFGYNITGVQLQDISLSQLNGSVTISAAGTAQVQFSITEDEITEGTETLTFTLQTQGGLTSSVDILDTSANVNFSIFYSSMNVDEGTTVSYWLESGQAELNGETLYWDADASAIQVDETAGTFVYNSASTYSAANPCWTVTPSLDTVLDDDMNFNVNLRRNGAAQPVVSSRVLNVYDISEDPFTVVVDTSLFFRPDVSKLSSFGGYDWSDKEFVFAVNSHNSDFQLRIRPKSGTVNETNLGLDNNTWYSLSVSSDPTNVNVVSLEFSQSCEFYLDFKGRGQLSFGSEIFNIFDIFSSASPVYMNGCKVTDVTNWGRQFEFTSFSQMFQNCPITNFSDTSSPFDNHTPASMKETFYNCSIFDGSNSGLSDWDISSITSLDSTFFNATAFVGPIGNWNTSNVTDMKGTFSQAHLFNSNISYWNVSNVTDMTSMFECVHNMANQPPNDQGTFNQDISSWDVTSVLSMNKMFFHHQGFNQDISTWCVAGLQQNSDAQNFNGGESALQSANTPDWGQACGTTVAVEVITSSATYNVRSQNDWDYMMVWAIGGGGGGGCASTDAGREKVASGGAGGGTAVKRYEKSSGISTFVATIGNFGLAGAASGGGAKQSGWTGGTTIFNPNAGQSQISATGGERGYASGTSPSGGDGSTSGSNWGIAPSPSGGVGSGGDNNYQGGGSRGWNLSSDRSGASSGGAPNLRGQAQAGLIGLGTEGAGFNEALATVEPDHPFEWSIGGVSQVSADFNGGRGRQHSSGQAGAAENGFIYGAGGGGCAAEGGTNNAGRGSEGVIVVAYRTNPASGSATGTVNISAPGTGSQPNLHFAQSDEYALVLGWRFDTNGGIVRIGSNATQTNGLHDTWTTSQSPGTYYIRVNPNPADSRPRKVPHNVESWGDDTFVPLSGPQGQQRFVRWDVGLDDRFNGSVKIEISSSTSAADIVATAYYGVNVENGL